MIHKLNFDAGFNKYCVGFFWDKWGNLSTNTILANIRELIYLLFWCDVTEVRNILIFKRKIFKYYGVNYYDLHNLLSTFNCLKRSDRLNRKINKQRVIKQIWLVSNLKVPCANGLRAYNELSGVLELVFSNSTYY